MPFLTDLLPLSILIDHMYGPYVNEGLPCGFRNMDEYQMGSCPNSISKNDPKKNIAFFIWTTYSNLINFTTVIEDNHKQDFEGLFLRIVFNKLFFYGKSIQDMILCKSRMKKYVYTMLFIMGNPI